MKLEKMLIKTRPMAQNKWHLSQIEVEDLQAEILDRIDIAHAYGHKKSKAFCDRARKHIVESNRTLFIAEETANKINELISELNNLTSDFFYSICEINVKEELLSDFRED